MPMDKPNSIALIIIGILSFMASKISTAMIIVFVFMILDYVTGIMALYVTGKDFDKKIAFKGIIKKLAYGLFLFMALCIDAVIFEKTSLMGVSLGFPIFTDATTIYILGTEGLSLISNLKKCGVNIPSWMAKPFELMIGAVKRAFNVKV